MRKSKENKKPEPETEQEEDDFDFENLDEDFSEEDDEDFSEDENNNNQTFQRKENDDETGDYDETNEEYLENPLHLAGKIYNQSDIYKQFHHLPHDVKLGFFDKFDKINFRYKSSAYQTFGYVQKISKMSRLELLNELLERRKLYDCQNLKDLEEYFKSNKKMSLYLNVKQQYELSDEELQQLLITQLKNVKELGLLDEIYGTKEGFYKVYNQYLQEVNEFNRFIDDIGLMNDMGTITETSKAFQGKERNSINTTINISREVRADEEAEEQPETPENSSGSGIKKFFRGKK